MGTILAPETRTGRTCPPLKFPDSTHHEAFVTGHQSRARLYTQHWLPDGSPKAVMLLCHGYADHTSWIFAEKAVGFFLSLGCAVYTLDYVGHGKSDGLIGCIESWEALWQDARHHFAEVRARHGGLRAFLFGESMGGAVALNIVRADPTLADGLILEAPMCQIGEEFLPPPIVISILRGLARVIPTWPLVPQHGDLIALCFKDPALREKALLNPFRYESRPRVITGVQLLDATLEVERMAPEITIPLLILHGAADKVTEPAASQDLYERAGSKDKELRMYPDAWHALFSEPEPTHSKVRQDVKEWLEARTK